MDRRASTKSKSHRAKKERPAAPYGFGSRDRTPSSTRAATASAEPGAQLDVADKEEERARVDIHRPNHCSEAREKVVRGAEGLESRP